MPACDMQEPECCTVHCDLDLPNLCPPGTACLPFFADGEAPPDPADRD